MIISKSLLSYDINKIIKSGNYLKNGLKYKVTLHNPNHDLYIDILKFIEVKRDYNNSIGDDIRVCLVLKASQYLKYVYRFKDVLEVTLEKKYGVIAKYRRYKAFIVKDDADKIKQNLDNLDVSTLDTLYPIEIELQLVEKQLYALANLNIEGTYQNIKLEDVLYSEYSIIKPKLILDGEDYKLDIVPLDNKNTYGNILIPSGTKIMNLATDFQDGERYGLYNGGVGTYYQRFNLQNYIYVYPLFDPKRYDKEKTKLQIFQDRSMKSGLDITFTQDGDILKIIPRYDTGILDMGESGLNISGNTIAYGDTDNNTKSFKNTTGDDLINDNKKNIKVMGIKDNKDGVNSVMYVGNTNNPYKYRTQILRNSMAVYSFKWDRCDIDLIYPGMPCAVIYENDKCEIVTLKGIVQGTAELYDNEHNGTTGTIHVAVISPSIYKDINNYESNL